MQQERERGRRVALARVALSRVSLPRVALPRACSPGVTWERNLLTWPQGSSQPGKTPATPWTLRVKHLSFFLSLFLFFFFLNFFSSPPPPWMVFASWELVKGKSSHSLIFRFPVKFWQFVSTARTCSVVWLSRLPILSCSSGGIYSEFENSQIPSSQVPSTSCRCGHSPGWYQAPAADGLCCLFLQHMLQTHLCSFPLS